MGMAYGTGNLGLFGHSDHGFERWCCEAFLLEERMIPISAILRFCFTDLHMILSHLEDRLADVYLRQ